MSVEKVIFHYFMSKYLVVLAGSPRGGELTYNSLYRNVVDHLSADLAICTTQNYYDDKISLFSKAKYKWLIKDYDNFFKYYEENFDGNWKEFFNFGKNTGLYESGSIHFVFKDIILKNYLKILKNYDFIIYTRFDQYYLYPHISGEKEKILIPEGEDYFGVCDRHAIVPVKFIDKFLNICEFINDSSLLDTNVDYLNCETAYLQHLTHEGLNKFIKRYPRTQFTSAEEKDKTNWRVPKYKILFLKDLWLKYPDEFIESCKSIRQKQRFFQFIINYPGFSIYYYYLLLRRFSGRLKKF